MLSPSLRQRSRSPSAEARVFADPDERLWSAAASWHGQGWAMVFACITDARQPIRVLALGDEARDTDYTEGLLRVWLSRAPRLGPLA